MARPTNGIEHVQAAKELPRAAKTSDELRQAQAVLLPLELGLSIQQTAAIIGRGATCTMRTRFMAVREGRRPAPRRKGDLRNHAKASLEQEAGALDEVMVGANEGQILVIPQLKPLIEQRLGQTMALSTVYRMLARHGWRKLAPDTRHSKGDPLVREDWKKNSPARWSKSRPASSAKLR